MKSFRGDCWEVYVISNSYEMPPRRGEAYQPFFGGHHPPVTVWNDQPATIVGGQGREIYPSLADSERKKSLSPLLSPPLQSNYLVSRRNCRIFLGPPPKVARLDKTNSIDQPRIQYRVRQAFLFLEHPLPRPSPLQHNTHLTSSRVHPY